MTSIVENLEPSARVRPLPRTGTNVDACKPFGVEVNAIAFDRATGLYDSVGFPAVDEDGSLAQFRGERSRTWSRMLAAEQELRLVYSWERGGRWALLDAWRSSQNSWVFQHLVSNGGAKAVRDTLLAAILHALDEPEGTSVAWESWFRPTNASAQRFFGASVEALGDDAGRADHAYIAVPKSPPASRSRRRSKSQLDVTIAEVQGAPEDLVRLASSTRHSAFPTAAALTTDPTLRGIDKLYDTVGLTRHRRIFTARDADGTMLGAALAHRGPIGLNMGFLENRCDLILNPAYSSASVARALVSAAAVAYQDVPLDYVPVMIAIDRGENRKLALQAIEWAERLSGSLLEIYTQAVWLRPGLPALAAFLQDTSEPEIHSHA